MPLSSMTGFARSQGRNGDCAWSWEIKSVNGRGLDVRCRLPQRFESLDQPARDRVGRRLKRGNVSLVLNVSWSRSEIGYGINQDLLDQILDLVPDLRKRFPEAGPPTLDGLLALRGVIELAEEEMSEEKRDALHAAMLSDLDQALHALVSARVEEGARLAVPLGSQIEEMARLCEEAERLTAMQTDAIRARIKAQVEALLDDVPGLTEERLTQEAAVIMTKADPREELDRLKAHIDGARDLLKEEGAIGRRFDFLCQEFNREANTLCSKSTDVELNRVGLALKATIDQMREQVQNIE